MGVGIHVPFICCTSQMINYYVHINWCEQPYGKMMN